MKTARILLAKGEKTSTNNRKPKLLLFCTEPEMAILFKERTNLFCTFPFYSG